MYFSTLLLTTICIFISKGQGWIPEDRTIVFVDNHDNQRGHGAGGSTIVTHKEPRLYKMAVAFTLAFPYGLARIMSSYGFENTEVIFLHEAFIYALRATVIKKERI